ncbi:MAG: hypothetical protein IH627_07310 [Rubrivivax sp.]|nr:hypothetical protein [Rubrivivax sp.]
MIQAIFFPRRSGDTRSVLALRRLRLLWLALAVAVLNAGVPVLGYAAMAGHGGLAEVICTPAGMKTIVVDADGQASQVDALSPHGGHCALCAMPAALPAPRSTLSVSGMSTCSVVGVAPTGLHPCFAATTPPATGPPALV